MSCERLQDRLSEYLDGDLSASERTEIEEHLRACVPCRRLARDLEHLGERVRRWDPEARPEKDLWPRIATRLGRDGAGDTADAADATDTAAGARGRRALRRWAFAAAAALAVGLAVPLTVDRLPWSGDATATADQSKRDRRAYDELVAAASLARAADGALQTRKDLEGLLAQNRGRLEDDVVAAMAVEVDRLQTAIGEIYQALETQPQNRLLRLQLAARYRQESDLLQRLGRV